MQSFAVSGSCFEFILLLRNYGSLASPFTSLGLNFMCSKDAAMIGALRVKSCSLSQGLSAMPAG